MEKDAAWTAAAGVSVSDCGGSDWLSGPQTYLLPHHGPWQGETTTGNGHRMGRKTDIQSCKLIPVMLLNVLLYRRRFSAHKYLVVALVTVGISLFMLLAPAKKKGGSDSAWGLTLLLIK